jgi:cytosine/adenosine deaminase-related metal-dependent hydrolase
MIILTNASVFSFSAKREFASYYILINGAKITDMIDIREARAAEKLADWIGKYKDTAEIFDCTNKIVMPTFINACLKSEGALINYLLRNRHYEVHDGDIYTDLIFNYIYQELEHSEISEDLDNIYNFSFARNLKSGISALNEFSLRKDGNHLSHITKALKITGQSASVAYPVRQEMEEIKMFKSLNPANYLTDENQLTMFDITSITELRTQGVEKLFLEIATNKDVTDNFRQTFGKPIIKYLDEYGLVDTNTFLINPLYLSYDELKIIKEKGASVIVCPRDLLYFTHRYFPIDDYINFGIKFSIGTGWLGEDIFKDLRYFRNKYKELNLSSMDLLRAITVIPYEMFFGGDKSGEDAFTIDINKRADMTMIDLSDIRFQFFPQSMVFEDICDFMVDNLTSQSFSEVILGGEFRVKNGRLVNADEAGIIKAAAYTRERLYKVGKYEQLAERKRQRESVQELDLSARDSQEIKMFSDSTGENAVEILDSKEEFRIKGKVSSPKRKIPQTQKNLFDDLEKNAFVQVDEYRETPEFNLLFTEVNELKEFDEEIQHNKLIDEKILKQSAYDKKLEKKKPEGADSKIELPKNVKLRFGDD